MNSLKVWAVAGLCAAALIVGGSWTLRGAAPAATQSARTPDAITADLKANNVQLHAVLPSLEPIADSAFRKGDGQRAIPYLKKAAALFAELAPSQPPEDAQDLNAARMKYLAMLVALGDGETERALQGSAASNNAEEALAAQSALALGHWWGSTGDAKEQDQVLDNFIVIAKAHPADNNVADTLMTMSALGSPGKAETDKAQDAIKTLTSPVAKQVQAELAFIAAQKLEITKMQQEQAVFVNKPLVLSGRTSTGGKLTTAEWKGKVILVDFWATWCVPCREEMPSVKALYAKYHGQGLEIVGVSSDSDEDLLNSFVKENDIPWPQLHDKDAQSGDDRDNPLAKQLKVIIYPDMFLIDRQGVLRYVDAGDDTEKKVQALLAEK